MLNNLNTQQFGHTSANTAHTSANGQGADESSAGTAQKSESSGGTQTVISIKGSAPNISTRA